MTKQTVDLFSDATNSIHHLAAHRKPRGQVRANSADLAEPIIGHFREQHDRLLEQNRQLIESQAAMHAKIDRLTNGIDRLVHEMHGIRTGDKSEAFARVGGFGCSPDLPTVRPDPALIYTHTATDIADQLNSMSSEMGLRSSEIGLLLGKRGLRWADNPDFQEVTRRKRPSQQRYWVSDMAVRLSKILDENHPEKSDIKDKAVIAVFRKWNGPPGKRVSKA